MTATRSPRRNFGSVEHPAAPERDAERLQVCLARQIDRDAFGLVGVLSGDREGRLRPAERQPEGCAFDAGQGPYSSDEILREAISLLERLILRRGQGHADYEQMLAFDARIHVLQHEERTHGQPGADQEHDGQRDFGDDEQVARPAAGRFRASAPTGSQDVGDIGLRGLQRRHETEEHSREHRYCQREEQHGHVDRDA